MRSIDSQLQREADHRKIKGSANFLYKTFGSIFPTNLDPVKGSLRLKVFSKIVSLGFIDFNDKNTRNIEEFKLFNARSTKKKVIDSFTEIGLIEKSGEGIYKKTNVGEAVWQSILNFLETHKPIEQQVTDSGGKIYEYSMWEITIDEKGNCWTLRNFGMKNLAKEPLKYVEHEAYALTSKYKGIFHLEHSDNIENYEITSDEDLSKKFKLNFKQPIKTGEYAEFWILYNWPEQYNTNSQELQFNYYSRKSLVKEFMLRMNFPKDYVINTNTMMKNNEGEPLPKDSIPFDPTIINQNNKQTMIWRIKNIHPKRKYILAWKKI